MIPTRSILRNRHAVWALAIGALWFGAAAYFQLPMQLFPDTAPPLVNVMTAWPGAAAQDVSDGMRPMEDAFASLEGITRIRSTAQDDLSVISLEFRYDRQVERAAVDVQNTIARVRGQLPAGVIEPQVLRFSTADRPVITFGAAGDDLFAVRRLAEDVFAPRLQQVPGVAAVDVFGGSAPAVIVEVDRRALERYRIPLARVVEAVRSQNAALPAGKLTTETRHDLYRVESRASDVEALARVPVPTTEGEPLRLGDLARIRQAALEDDARFAIDGQRAIALQVFKSVEANTVDVVDAVSSVVASLALEYPEVRLIEGEESASFVKLVVGNLLENVWQALALASAVIFLFLRSVRPSLVAAASMPLSYAITFALMHLFGVELNMVTLSAIILAVGMVVDASVVVLENVTRRREADGLAPEDAAALGTDEVRLPVIAGVATTLMVLIPLLFLDGFIGRTFRPLALTMVLAFTSSVVVALTLVPVLSAYTGGPPGRLDRGVFRATRPLEAAIRVTQRGYVWLLQAALRRRSLALIVAVLAFALGIAGIRARGMEVLPKMDGGSFFVSLETPSGTSLGETERVVRDVEAILAAQPEVEKVQSQVGYERGMRSMSASGVQGPTQGFVTVTLSPRTSGRADIWQVQARVREQVRRLPGLQAVTVRELGNSAKSTTLAPVVVRIAGPDPLVLDRLGGEIVHTLEGVDGVIEPLRTWRADRRQRRVKVDVLRAGQLGLTPSGVAGLLKAGTDGMPAGKLYDGQGSPLPIWVRYSGEGVHTSDAMLAQPVLAPGSPDPVPLSWAVSLDETIGPGMVTRDDLSEVLEVSAFTDGRALSFVTADVERTLAGVVAPRGYEVSLTGERRDLGEAKRSLGAAIALAIAGVYLLLVAQFRSFLHPLTVLLSVPLSLSGVGIALFVAGKSVSMPVMVGLVLLVGVVVNNAIILVDFVNRAREEGTPRREALVDAVRVRFRPIMMTSLSTILGMVPLAAEWALGAERFSPLATAVIGGMASATVLTLVFIPVLYDLFDDVATAVLRRGPKSVATAGTAAMALLVAPASTFAEPIPLDLATGFELARAHSYTLHDRHDAAEVATAKAKEVRARRLPRMEVQARYSRLNYVEPRPLALPFPQPDGQPSEPLRIGDPLDSQTMMRIVVDQPIFTGGALTHAERAARFAEQAAREGIRAAEADLRLELTELYFQWVQTRELAAVATQSVDTILRHLEKTTRLVSAGRAPVVRRHEVEARLAQARMSATRARGAEATSHLALVSFLGLPDDAVLVPSEPLSMDDPAPAHHASTAQPVEVELADLKARATAEQAAATGGTLWPQVLVRLGANYDSPNQRYFPLRDEFNESWDASVVLSWTVWDWGLRRHSVRAAELEAAQAERAVLRVADQMRLAEARARLELETEAARVETARIALHTAEQSQRSTQTLVAAGRLDELALLDRQNESARARAELVQALASRRIAQARLERILGKSSGDAAAVARAGTP